MLQDLNRIFTETAECSGYEQFSAFLEESSSPGDVITDYDPWMYGNFEETKTKYFINEPRPKKGSGFRFKTRLLVTFFFIFKSFIFHPTS